ncbi:MAG: adenylate cyclase [Actinomycetota bacterium]|jgi:adenylate cyclase
MVELLSDRDPEFLNGLVEVGVVSRDFAEDTGAGVPVRNAPPLSVIERLLERSIERKPSLMAAMGLSAIQLLAANDDATSEDGASTAPSARMAVAFTDLEGFTCFTERNGDEAASHLVADHHRTVGPIVRSRGGRVVKRIGDGLLLTFPEPEAAVLACLELVDTPPPPLRLRAGIHVGDVLTTRDDVVGHVVNVAARVAESAKGGEVVVTGDVRDAIGDMPRVEVGRARRRTFKGLAEAIPVARVTYAR